MLSINFHRAGRSHPCAAERRATDPIDAIVNAEMASQRIPGMAVAVIRKGEIVKAQGYGLANVEHNVPVTAQTIFQSGSLGKQFTAAAVMLQVQDGRLSLTDPIDEVLRRRAGGVARHHRAPPAHAHVGHSGLHRRPARLSQGLFARTSWSSSPRHCRSTSRLAPNGSTATPATSCSARSCARSSGSFYGDVLRDRVFKPLGMTTARVISEADIVPNRAAGYRLERGRVAQPAVGVADAQHDSGRFAVLVVAGLIAWDRGIRNGAVLQPESWRADLYPVTLNSGRVHPYGFGFEVDRIAGQNIQRHGGSWQGFKTYIARYGGDDITIIALANARAGQSQARRRSHCGTSDAGT